MISQRAWLIGGVGFCFYLIAIVNTLASFYYALTWLAVGVLASSLGIALLSLIGLRCAWRAPHAIVSQSLETPGSADEMIGPTVEVQLANAGTLNKTGVLIEVHLARVPRASGNTTQRAAKSENELVVQRFLLEALPSGQSVTTQLPLLNLPRGRYRVVELRLFGSDVLGLFSIQKRVPPGLQLDDEGKVVESPSSAPGSEEIMVGPAALPTPENFMLHPALSRGDGGAPAARFSGQGDEMRGTRLYAPGDDLRRVHWKSTARKGQLVVKEFHHTLQSRVLVVWDGAAGTDWGEKDSDFNALEWGLRVVASLCRAMQERHQSCALLRLDGQPLWVGQEGGARRAAGATQPDATWPSGALSNTGLTMTQVSQALCDAAADRGASLLKAMNVSMGAAFTAGHQRQASQAIGGDIYFVTASLSPEVPHAVRQWRARGARVTVALLDGAAFMRNNAKSPIQRWGGSPQEIDSQDASHSDVSRSVNTPATSGEVAVTRENYSAQAQALRAASARVVMVSPAPGARGVAALNTALLDLLQTDKRLEAGDRGLEYSSPSLRPPVPSL